MNEFSKRSMKHLSMADPLLIALFRKVLKVHDCSILCGYRDAADQNRLLKRGLSKLQFPNSKHNQIPSLAVDVAPYPHTTWTDMKRFYHFIGIVKGIASEMDIKIRCGNDWDMDNDLDDQKFNDLIHFELVE